MLITQILIVLLVSSGLSVIYFKGKDKIKSDIFLKILSGVIAGVLFIRYMSGDDALSQTTGLVNPYFDSPIAVFISILLNWAIYSVILLIALYPYYKEERYSTILKFYGFGVALLSICFIYPVTIGITGEKAYSGFNFRTMLMGIELGIMLAYSVIVFFENGKFRTNKDDYKCIFYILVMLFVTIPSYTVQGIFGYLNYGIKIKSLKLPHRIILYFAFLVPLGIYLMLRKMDEKKKKGILIYICLGTLLSFSLNHRFDSFTNITHWPFHLCNTAMYILPLCLIFNMKRLFYFTYFINVFGAFAAMIAPNYATESNLFSTSILVFYTNHYIAFSMPLLIVALKIYERPKLKQFIYSLYGFAFYFILVLILNAWFTNYNASVDYFFINSGFIAEKLGLWAENLRNYTWSFGIGSLTFTFYPIYQVLYFIIYIIISAGMWFVYEGAYSFVDTVYDIQARKQKINADILALQVKYGKKNLEDIVNTETLNKIVLENFSKKYDKSDCYAVHNANLEINGGEIFGFLGHNGAGKSTIIKSIVGIQPITSGKIEVCGYDIEKQPVLAKKNIGYVPDHYALYEKLTGREYINYIADLYDVSTEDRNKAIEKYVSLFELQGAFDNQIRTYSHGMKQKITIISALVHNPKVWILDEPLTGLDPTSIYQVKECMRQHASQGNIVFFSSHLIDIVESLCDKIAIIKNGNILACEKVSDIEKNTTLEKYFLEMGKTEVERYREN